MATNRQDDNEKIWSLIKDARIAMLTSERDGRLFSRPMGAAVIGGLIASTVLSLFVVPVIYTIFDDWEHWVRRKFSRGAHAAEKTPAAPAVPD